MPTAVRALHRFGLSPRPGEARAIANDPRGYLEAQLLHPLEPIDALTPSAQGHLLRHRFVTRQRIEREGGGNAEEIRKAYQTAARRDMLAWIAHTIEAERPFAERLAMFFANLLFVPNFQRGLQPLRGGYENDVIRAHALGRYGDMAEASSRHPAMLLYLDQTSSVGPNSPAGLRRDRGLNENYARELMELHTLGVDGGYRQDDVGALARLLTGWSIVSPQRRPDLAGKAVFRSRLHEPGPHVVLGRRYDGEPAALRERVVLDLAAHPSSARHVAARLIRWFVPGPPDPALVRSVSRAYEETGGDIPAMARALVRSDAAWRDADSPAGFLPPQDWVIAAARAIPDRRQTPHRLFLMRTMGHRPWAARSPAGYPPMGQRWFGAQALESRLKAAQDMAARVRLRDLPSGSPLALADALFGDALSSETRTAVEQAASPSQALAILAMAPEFLLR